MEVKIYREPENESLILDEEQLNEYNKLATELGLQPKEREEKKQTPNIYPCLNQAMKKQLEALCPTKTPAEKYTRSTIPVEVLRVYKYAKDNEMFDEFQIWYADKEPDPLLIGRRWQTQEAKEKDYSWMKDDYLIARWGDCALELDKLLAKGYQSIKQSVVDSANLALEKVGSMVKNPDIYVRNFLKGENLDIRIDTSGSTTELPF